MDATGQRWVAALSLYDFQIYYRSGKRNANADALSRIPWERTQNYEVVKMDAVTVKATMTKAENPYVPMERESVVSMAAQFFAPNYAPQMSLEEWRQEQNKDLAISKVVTLIKNGSLLEFRNGQNQSTEFQNYLKNRRNLVLIEGLLHQRVQLKHQQVETNRNKLLILINFCGTN